MDKSIYKFSEAVVSDLRGVAGRGGMHFLGPSDLLTGSHKTRFRHLEFWWLNTSWQYSTLMRAKGQVRLCSFLTV